MKKNNWMFIILSAFFSAFFIRCALGLGITDDEGGATPTLTQMVEKRGKLLEQIEAIENDPQGKHDADDTSTEKRYKKGDANGEFSKEQRDELAKLNAEYDALDKKCEQRQKQVDRRNKQKNDEQRARSTDLRIVPDVHSGYSEAEHRALDEFSVARAVQLLSEGRSLDGVEAEMAQEGRNEAAGAGIEVEGRSVMFSAKALKNRESRDMTADSGTSGNQGGMTIETQKLGLLDAIFNALVFQKLGATFLTGLTGNVDVPRLVAGTTPTGKAENAQATEQSPTTAQVSFSPKRLPTVIEVSNKLMKQSNVQGLDAVLRRYLVAQLSSAMESQFINGAGTVGAEGILQTTGIGSVVGGANGAAIDWQDIVDLEEAVDQDNLISDMCKYLTNGKVISKLKTTPRVASTDSVMLLDPTSNELNGYAIERTNNVPRTLTKGSGSSLSAMLFGHFPDYWVTQWSGIEFLINPYSKDDYGLTRINAAVYYDGHAIRPESFAAMSDIVTT